jgi:hypothetical protein
MAIHKILAPLSNKTEGTATLRVAGEIATYFNAHVEVVIMNSNLPAAKLEGLPHRSSNTSPDLVTVFEQWRYRHRLELQSECTYRALASTSLVIDELSETRLCERSRFADLVCFAVEPGKLENQHSLGAALFSSGRPILLCPVRDGLEHVDVIGAPIVIGWNGSVEAVHAVAGALPFIQASRRVEVIAIGEKSVKAFDAYELAKYLAWTGVRALATGIAIEDWTGGDVIDAAVDKGAKLLVIGARENGNATSHILQTLPMMALMAA